MAVWNNTSEKPLPVSLIFNSFNSRYIFHGLKNVPACESAVICVREVKMSRTEQTVMRKVQIRSSHLNQDKITGTIVHYWGCDASSKFPAVNFERETDRFNL